MHLALVLAVKVAQVAQIIINSQEEVEAFGNKMNLIPLNDEAQLISIANGNEPVVLFKHSTRCSVSNMAWKMFQQEWNDSVFPVYYLDLLNFRSISNAIATQFQITHESPQVLVIKNGQCTYHASHQSIEAASVLAELNN